MNVALIDMGSNSIRLAVYKVEQKDFEPIFSKRYMTGLASYVKEKQLTAAGVEQACIVLMDAKSCWNSFRLTRQLFLRLPRCETSKYRSGCCCHSAKDRLHRADSPDTKKPFWTILV
ncbi:MAG: hypothetical protein ACLS6W_09475 [Ruminococcus sp.]